MVTTSTSQAKIRVTIDESGPTRWMQRFADKLEEKNKKSADRYRKVLEYEEKQAEEKRKSTFFGGIGRTKEAVKEAWENSNVKRASDRAGERIRNFFAYVEMGQFAANTAYGIARETVPKAMRGVVDGIFSGLNRAFSEIKKVEDRVAAVFQVKEELLESARAVAILGRDPNVTGVDLGKMASGLYEWNLWENQFRRLKVNEAQAATAQTMTALMKRATGLGG